MIIDYELELSLDQAETTVATHASTNYANFTKPGDAYKQLFLDILVKEAVTSAGAATVNIQLITDDNSSFSSATVLWETGALAKTVFTLGKRFTLPIPFGMEQYTRVNYVIGTAELTAGKFDARFVSDVPHRSGLAI